MLYMNLKRAQMYQFARIHRLALRKERSVNLMESWVNTASPSYILPLLYLKILREIYSLLISLTLIRRGNCFSSVSKRLAETLTYSLIGRRGKPF